MLTWVPPKSTVVYPYILTCSKQPRKVRRLQNIYRSSCASISLVSLRWDASGPNSRGQHALLAGGWRGGLCTDRVQQSSARIINVDPLSRSVSQSRSVHKVSELTNACYNTCEWARVCLLFCSAQMMPAEEKEDNAKSLVCMLIAMQWEAMQCLRL